MRALNQVSSRKFYFFCVVFFLSSRILPVFTAVERVSHYDELEIGAIARDFIHPHGFPVWSYQMDPYGGQSIVLGALAVPFVSIFGNTLLAVKIPSFLFAFSIFCFSIHFLRKFFSESAARRGAMLLICAPPALLQCSLAGLSGHGEKSLFTLLILYFFAETIKNPARKIYPLVFGVISGFGFWFYHQTIVMTAACLLVWIWKRPKIHVLWIVPGIFIGLTPWFCYEVFYHRQDSIFLALQMRAAVSLIVNFRSLWNEFFNLICLEIPFSFCFFPVLNFIPEKIYSLVYFMTAYMGSFALIFCRKKSKPFSTLETTFMVFLLASIAAILFSSFKVDTSIGYVGFRYLTDFHYIMLLVIAVFLETKWLLNLILALGLLGQSSILFHEPFGKVQQYSGYSYYHVGTQWQFLFPQALKSPQGFIQKLSSYDQESARQIVWGISEIGRLNGEVTLLKDSPSLPLLENIEEIGGFAPAPMYQWLGELRANINVNQIPSDALPYYRRGMARIAVEQLMIESPDCFECVAQKDISPEWKWLEMGFYLGSENFYEGLRKIRESSVSSESKSFLIRGLALSQGRRLWDSNTVYDQKIREIVYELLESEKNDFFWGLGWNVRLCFLHDKKRALDNLRHFPEDQISNALVGFNAFESWYLSLFSLSAARLDEKS